MRLWSASHDYASIRTRARSKVLKSLFGWPRIYDYKKLYKGFFTEFDLDANIMPTIIPNWDHTPRSGNNGFVLSNSTPQLFKEHAKDVIKYKSNTRLESVIFLKSWNEWGEGNYMEPDIKWGKQYIYALKEALE